MPGANFRRRTSPEGNIAAIDFGVVGDKVMPTAITTASGLTPTRSWERGDVYPSRSGKDMSHPWGLWAIEFTGSDVEEVARTLVAVVEPRVESIRRAADQAGATIAIGIWWDPEGGQGGFSVSSDIMRRLSELCERVDVYFPG